jgi:uncharacterized membrane protein AbrB (regulator of aidB expression)
VQVRFLSLAIADLQSDWPDDLATNGDYDNEKVCRNANLARYAAILGLVGGYLIGQGIISVLPLNDWSPRAQFNAAALIPVGCGVIGLSVAHWIHPELVPRTKRRWKIFLIIIILGVLGLYLIQPD